MPIELSNVDTALSKVLDGIRRLFKSKSSPEKKAAWQPGSSIFTPWTITCVEHITYHVEVDERVDYDPPTVTGEILVRIPCTAAYLPWRLNQQRPLIEYATCGELAFQNCAEAIVFEEADIAESFHTADLDFHHPIQVPLSDAQAHFASGDTFEGAYRYRPRLSKEFPITITVELSDAPAYRPEQYLRLPEEDRSATYLDELQLRIKIQAHLSNLTQDAEREILKWIDEASRNARKHTEMWRQVVDALTEKKKIDSDLLEKLDRDTPPELEEAQEQMADYGQLARCIQGVQETLRSIKGDLLIEDLRQAIVDARSESQALDLDRQRALAWLEELEQHIGEAQGPHLRYVGIEWPQPEPRLGWQPSQGPFPGEGDWIYNPERGRLECREIRAEWRSEAMYYEGEVTLPLQRPAGAMQFVKGYVTVETDRLLSGLYVGWEPSEIGSQRQPEISRTSVIEIDFDVNLEAVFKRRRFAVSRTLMLEGLLPSDARVRELKDVLADAGLTVTSTHSASLGQGTAVAAIWRREGLPQDLRREGLNVTFAALINGHQERAKHILMYDEDRQRVERGISVGSLRVQLRAIGAGDPQAVVSKVDELLLRLQERWGQGDADVWQGTWYREAER